MSEDSYSPSWASKLVAQGQKTLDAIGGEKCKSDDPAEQLGASVVSALRSVYDPEIPVNIYDLGLIYDVKVADDNSVDVTMTLTTPGCPVAQTFPGMVEARVREVPGVTDARVELVWDPPWTRERMSEDALLELGLL